MAWVLLLFECVVGNNAPNRLRRQTAFDIAL
jgi:hypothetical protein